jgi:hypothetical protein
VLNLQGQPEAGVQVRTTVERTGAVLELHQTDHPVGVYTVLDDSHVGQLQFQGDKLQVVGSKNGLGFTVEIVARPDGPCRCHIDKVSGPEVVTLQ